MFAFDVRADTTHFRLVDDITYREASKTDKPPTSSAILGPFWRADAPIRENGTTITFNTPKDGLVAYMHGQVTDAETGKPLPNTSVDVWQASTNGTSIMMILNANSH